MPTNEKAQVPMTLEGAVQELEDIFKVVPWDGEGPVAPNGEPYVALTLGGIRTEDEIARLFLADALELAGKENKTLYWREKPRLDRRDKDLYLHSRLCFGA